MRTTLLRLLPLVALFATGCVIEVEDDDDDWGDGGYAGSWSGGAAGQAGTSGKAGAAGAGGVAGAGGSAGAGGAAGGPSDQPAFVRFAHLAPHVGAVDVCLRPVGFTDSWAASDYVFGPVFLNNADEKGADPLDFYFPGVSTYFELSPPGQWEVRVVPALGDLVAIDCKTAFADVADRTLDLTAGEAVTVALSGDVAADGPNTSPVTLGWVPYVEPTPNEEAAPPVAQVVNALSGGAAVTLGSFDPLTQKAEPLVSSATLATNDSSFTQLPTEPTRYVFLSSLEAGSTLVTPAPAIAISAQPGEFWSFFAAGTDTSDPAAALQPQAIACKNVLQGLGVTSTSLIAADCTYLNSKVPIGSNPQPQPDPEPAPPPTKLARAGEGRSGGFLAPLWPQPGRLSRAARGAVLATPASHGRLA